MARSPENFKNTTQLGTSAVDIISAVATNTKAIVRKLSFRNTGSSTRTVTVYVVESGGSAGATSELAVKAIPAGKEWNVIVAQNEVFSVGMKLQAKQDSGTDVNANCSGEEVT